MIKSSSILNWYAVISLFARLRTVNQGGLLDDEREPLPGIGLLNAPLIAFAEFFQIIPNLDAAAAKQSSRLTLNRDGRHTTLVAIAILPDSERTNLLGRFTEGDPLVAMEVHKKSVKLHWQSLERVKSATSYCR